jgi:hypothetical protein
MEYILNYEVDTSYLGTRGRMLSLKEMCLGVRLIRDELMMIYLDCQLDWTKKCLGDY